VDDVLLEPAVLENNYIIDKCYTDGMATLIFGVGVPGSGKTTILQKLSKNNSIDIVSILKCILIKRCIHSSSTSQAFQAE
jgi:stage III sporulation protein SpoIIIAA